MQFEEICLNAPELTCYAIKMHLKYVKLKVLKGLHFDMLVLLKLCYSVFRIFLLEQFSVLIKNIRCTKCLEIYKC